MKYGKFVTKEVIRFDVNENLYIRKYVKDLIKSKLVGKKCNSYDIDVKTLSNGGLEFVITFDKVIKGRDIRLKTLFEISSLSIMLSKNIGYVQDGGECPDFQYDIYLSIKGKSRKYRHRIWETAALADKEIDVYSGIVNGIFYGGIVGFDYGTELVDMEKLDNFLYGINAVVNGENQSRFGII